MAQLLHNAQSILIRKHDIQQYQRRYLLLQPCIKISGTFKALYLIARIFQRKHLDLPDVFIIFYDINHCHIIHSVSSVLICSLLPLSYFISCPSASI